MKREEKDVIIGEIAELLTQYPNVYVTDTSTLTVEKTNQLRRLCFSKGVKMLVAKNTLIRKANYQMGYRLGYSKHFSAITKRSAPLDWSYSPLQMQGFELGIFFKPGK